MKKQELNKIKQDVSKALELLRLSERVALEEIETELSEADTALQSLLLLGIIRSIMKNQNDEAAKLFIPAIIEWRNYLPHKDLNGLSPAEYMDKYPPGPEELLFIKEMVDEYQRQLEINQQTGGVPAGQPDEPFNVEADFAKFQKSYLERVPAGQIFSQDGNHLMTIKEIIITERRRNGQPEKDIDQVGAKIFVENTAEGIGEKIAKIDDQYIKMLKELERMEQNPKWRNKARVRAIREKFREQEPYHRLGPTPHQFYSNCAAAALFDDADMELVKSLLNRSLSYKPDYQFALKMKRGLENFQK